MQFDTKRDTLVGGAIVLIAAFVFVFSYAGKNMAKQSNVGTYPVTAVFNRIDGLFEGDVVRMAGIKVGSVGQQILDKNYRASVTLNLLNGIKIPSDSAVAIHTDGLFGSKFVVIEPGVEDTNLGKGSHVQFTQGAVVVSELLGLIIDQGKARLAKQKSQQGGK